MIYTPLQLERMKERREGYALAFGGIVKELIRRGVIKNADQVGHIAYSVTLSSAFNFAAVCREAAGISSEGFFTDIGENAGMRWSMGNMVAGILLPVAVIPGIREAQAIVSQVIPAYHRPLDAWTNGSNARQLVRYVLEKAIPNELSRGSARKLLIPLGAEDLLTPTDLGEEVGERAYQYHDCKPGEYPSIIMYDAEAFYFNLICRLKCLRLDVYPPNTRFNTLSKPVISWGGWQGSEYERWRDVLGHIGETKLLRNALWGVLLGSSNPRAIYTSASKKAHRKKLYDIRLGGEYWVDVPASPKGRVRRETVVYTGGMARGAGLLVGRGGAEVCSEASWEVSSVYSTLDSVSVIDGGVPKTWDKLGLPSGIKERGGGEIVARGVWRIGPHHTADYYEKGGIIPPGYVCPVERSPVERRAYELIYNRLWL